MLKLKNVQARIALKLTYLQDTKNIKISDNIKSKSKSNFHLCKLIDI